MKDYLFIELNDTAATPKDAAKRVKDALVGQGDNTTNVFVRTKNAVLVLVHESNDAEDEIADKMNKVGFSCFISATNEVIGEDDEGVEITNMTKKPIETIETADEAQSIAIEWQKWQSDQSLSYGEMAEWQAYFESLSNKFDLSEEFKENGIC